MFIGTGLDLDLVLPDPGILPDPGQVLPDQTLRLDPDLSQTNSGVC